MIQMQSKLKYRQEKTRSKYKPSHNDNNKSTKHKSTEQERREMQARQPKVTLVMLPSGKKRFVHEYPEN
jgi:hypothetical protein